MRELRALAIGLGVGAVGAISNVFVALKAGWSLPVMTTAAVVGLGVARAQKRPLAASEAVIATSLASATAFMTGGGNLAAVPAAVMLGLRAPSTPALIAWFALTAMFGTLLAPLLGRSLRELPFPTATAAATLLTDDRETTRSRSALWVSTLGGGLFALVRKLAGIPATIGGAWTFGLDTSLLLTGVGALMTWSTAWSTLVGGVITYRLIAPRLVEWDMAEATYRSLVSVMVWPAASLLVASALTELALDVRFSVSPKESAEGPVRWRAPLVVAVLVTSLGRFVFELSWPVLVASLPVAVIFAYVAARSMGETDVVPTKALAPLAQATVALAGSGVAGPAIAPNLTGAAAIHAADTLGSLKLAATLGVSAETAVRVRLVGSVVGAVVVAITFGLVVPDMHALPTPDLPAPAVLVWKSVAEVVGAGQLPPHMRGPIVAGALVGIALAVLSRVKRIARFVPSAMGLGSGMVLPASTAISIFAGAVARRFLEPRRGLAVTMAIASGVIAGESLVSLALQLHR
jgi:uncharacterized oligopeptide transporter (OPT) family protein